MDDCTRYIILETLAWMMVFFTVIGLVFLCVKVSERREMKEEMRKRPCEVEDEKEQERESDSEGRL